MKRIITFTILLGLLLAGSCFAAGSVTGTCSQQAGGAIKMLTLAWVGDSSSGVVPTKAFSAITGCMNMTASQFVDGTYFCGAEANTTVAHRPTALYDIEILDPVGVDKMGNNLHDLGSNATVEVQASFAGLPGCKFFQGPLTFSLTNNSVGSAAGTVTLFFAKP